MMSAACATSMEHAVLWAVMVRFFYAALDLCFVFFFFYQAEDGIRATSVTGVQTCALPISDPARLFRRRIPSRGREQVEVLAADHLRAHRVVDAPAVGQRLAVEAGRPPKLTRQRHREIRSEERRVGKEWILIGVTYCSGKNQ